MRDSISLRVNGLEVTSFISYSIESDLYQAADAFSVELKLPETDITGPRCELYVNGELELTGIIDKPIGSHNKGGAKLRLEGRDLMGLLVDHHCEDFLTLKGYTVKVLTERLLQNVPFIDRKSVVYEENLVGSVKKKGRKSAVARMDTAHAYAQIEPGQNTFEVISAYAMSRGLLFYSLPNGTFVIGKPKAGGEARYRLITRRDGKGNNVKEATLYRDFSRRYSKITVLGQQQGTDDLTASQINTKAIATDSAVPYYKPFVTRNNGDGQSPQAQAQAILEKQRFDGWQYFCKVAGHSQDGRNYKINELAHIQDEVLGVDGVYLIYNRVLELSKDEGPVTWLKLGPPGVVGVEA